MASCYANQLGAQLRRQMPSLLLLWGEDAGAIRQSAQEAIALSGVDPADPFAADTLTLNDLLAEPSRLPDRAGSIAFGGGRRLVRLTGISGDESAAAVKTLTEAVETTLAMPLSDVFIVLPVPGLLDKSHALVKGVEQHPQGLSVRFFADNARDLNQWLQNEFKTASKPIETDALALLATHLGADRDLARREVEKLLLYAGEESPVTAEMVRASISGATPADVFRLSDAIGRRDTAAADRILQQLLEQGEDLNPALTQAIRHLQRLQAVQQGMREGASPEEAVRRLKPPVPAPMQADLIQQARSYPPKRLATLIPYALETVTAARSGLLDSQHVLSRALLALAARGPA